MAITTTNQQPSINNSGEMSQADYLEKLESKDYPNSIKVRSGNKLVGTYTFVDGDLVYRSGPKKLIGSRARKYFAVDVRSPDMTVELVHECSSTDPASTNGKNDKESGINVLSASAQH